MWIYWYLLENTLLILLLHSPFSPIQNASKLRAKLRCARKQQHSDYKEAEDEKIKSHKHLIKLITGFLLPHNQPWKFHSFQVLEPSVVQD